MQHYQFIFAMLLTGIALNYLLRGLIGNFHRLLEIYTDPESDSDDRSRAYSLAISAELPLLMYLLLLILTSMGGSVFFAMEVEHPVKLIGFLAVGVQALIYILIVSLFPTINWANNAKVKLKRYELVQRVCVASMVTLAIVVITFLYTRMAG